MAGCPWISPSAGCDLRQPRLAPAGGRAGPDDLGQASAAACSLAKSTTCAAEWAVGADDILWRRTKLGLFTSAAEQQTLKDYLQDSRAGVEAA
jgi:glycerol-3-phosphate dehydrogenase